MPLRNAEALWNGTLQDGHGTMRLGSGAFEGAYSYKSRFENGKGTNPEELIGAAHAGCFSMALALILGKAGFEPKRITTRAAVTLSKTAEGFRIARIQLETEGDVPRIDAAAFSKHAEEAKTNCPVSVALAGTSIDVKASLAG